MQIISFDKTVRSETVQDLEDLNSQSISTKAKKGEELVSMMPAVKKAFDPMGEHSSIIYKRGCFEKQNWLLGWKMLRRI